MFVCFLQPLPYVPTITNYTQLWWVPNVVVAHQKEGIEAVHLATGRTLCKVIVSSKKIWFRLTSCSIFQIYYSWVIHTNGLCFINILTFWLFLINLRCHLNVDQLHLTEGGLHADINGDGVLDHVQVWTVPINVQFWFLLFNTQKYAQNNK